MATRDTKGRREIEAAKQRLSLAKSHASFVSTTLKTVTATEDAAKKAWKKAKRAREEIQAQDTSSEKEVSDAQKFLAEVEARWEVIAIDIDDDNISKNDNNGSSSNKKKRKYDHTNDSTTDDQVNNVIEQSPTATRPVISINNNRSFSLADNISEIVVQNCGTPPVNGTYKRNTDQYGRISFVKRGEAFTKYALYHHDEFWYISYWLGSHHESSMLYYRTNQRTIFGANNRSDCFHSLMYAEWVQIKGRAPLPTLTFKYN